jgi:hypothetical protein
LNPNFPLGLRDDCLADMPPMTRERTSPLQVTVFVA